MGVKMEEEVPRVLKMLGYPFNISKSSMHAAGTPHTWPYLLAALVWMVELVKVRCWSTCSLSPRVACLQWAHLTPGSGCSRMAGGAGQGKMLVYLFSLQELYACSGHTSHLALAALVWLVELVKVRYWSTCLLSPRVASMQRAPLTPGCACWQLWC